MMEDSRVYIIFAHDTVQICMSFLRKLDEMS